MIDDEDFGASQSTTRLRTAAALLGTTAMFTLVFGVHLRLVTFVDAWLNHASYGWLALGTLLVYLAAMVLRARAWATLGATAVGAFIVVATTSWTLYLAVGGMVSCASFLVTPLALAATVACGLAHRDARRATAARGRLADAGMDLGL